MQRYFSSAPDKKKYRPVNVNNESPLMTFGGELGHDTMNHADLDPFAHSFRDIY